MMKNIIGRRAMAGCLAACLALSVAAGSVFAQGVGDSGGGALPKPETDGYINGQPNYVYKAMGAASDALFGQQWGLYNDGSFEMKEKANSFPVFDNPFEDPWGRDQWLIMPDQIFQWSSESNASVRNGSEPNASVRNGSESNASAVNGSEASAGGGKGTVTVGSVEGVDINVSDAWNRFDTNGEEVIVAIIDTGVDYTNSQLANAVWVNEGEIAGDGIDNDGNGYVDDVHGWNFYDGNNKVFSGEEDNHGTHGAGTIAAKRDGEGTAGIAGSSNVKIMSLKALGGKDGSGTTESILKAIQYAEANGASICNLSLGTTGNDKTLREAIANSNMLFVAAAGNGLDWTGTGANTDLYPTYPAAWNLDNLISVANLQPDGTLHYSSNYGKNTIDIAAPGSYILSTLSGGGYGYMTGTSMAAPMVSGVAAMLYSQYGDMTAKEARNIILTSARSMTALSGKVRTGGMLDAGAALALSRTDAKDYTEGTNEGGPTTVNTPSADFVVDKPESAPPQTGTQPVENKGRAPVIQIAASSDFGLKRYLTVNVTDADGDLKAVRYAEGTKGAAWFKGGQNGTSFSLDARGSGTFSYSGSGTYTFYAVDSQGNETVSTVKLSDTFDMFDDFSNMFRRVLRW